MAKGSSLRYASVAAMPEAMRRQAEKQLGGTPPTGPAPGVQAQGPKYRNTPTIVDGIRFDSKREARYYELLKLEKAGGRVLFFLRQVPFHLPGGTRLVVDFLVFDAAGGYRVVDAKGVETKEFKIKRREVEHHFPIRLVLV